MINKEISANTQQRSKPQDYFCTAALLAFSPGNSRGAQKQIIPKVKCGKHLKPSSLLGFPSLASCLPYYNFMPMFRKFGFHLCPDIQDMLPFLITELHNFCKRERGGEPVFPSDTNSRLSFPSSVASGVYIPSSPSSTCQSSAGVVFCLV